MDESAENVSEQRVNKGGFLEGRKASAIGCLLVLLFVIGILI